MTATEKAAILDTYNACLVMLQHHASICTEAQGLALDMEASIRRRMGEVEKTIPAEAEKRKGK